ncbi:MAG: translocation/assembly module TamB [Syntrophobacteraceae bacterium]|nr:translocation/assembly module TamB [Syntrophobacteraceae bacterium]
MSNGNDAKDARPRRVPFPVKIAAWVVGIALCLALPVMVALHSPSVQRKIITGGIERIEKATHLEVKISSYRWESLSSVSFTGVKIESRGKRVLDCDDVRLDYALSVERPYIVIKEVDLKRPFLKIERGADGQWLVPSFSAAKSDKTEEPPGRPPAWTRFQLPRIKIHAGTIEAVQQGNTVLSIKDFSGAVNLRALGGAGGPKFQMEFGRIHARAYTGQCGTWDLDGSALLDGQKFSAQKIVLSGPSNCRILVRGNWNIDHPQNGEANLSISNLSAGDIPELGPQLGGLSSLSGTIAIKRSQGKWTIEPDVATDIGAIKGVLRVEKTKVGPYAVALDSRFSDFKIQASRDLPDSRLNGWVKIAALMQGQTLLKADFKAHLGPSTVCARKVERCDLGGTFENGILNIVSTQARCSLADFQFQVNADLRGLTDTDHKGGIRAQISLIRGNLDKLDPRLRYKMAGKIGLDAHYNPGNFTTPGLWQAKIDTNLGVPGVLSLKGSVALDNRVVKGVYDLDLVDAQKLGVLFAKWQGKGRVVSKGSFNGKWPDLLWNGEIRSPRFSYGNCQADRLSIKGKASIAGKNDRRQVAVSAQNLVVYGKKFASVNLDLDQHDNSCGFKVSANGIFDRGSARLSGNLDRIWDFPHLSVSTRGSLGWKKLNGAVDARFEVEQHGIKVDSASFRYGDSKISTSGGAISQTSVKLPLSLDSIDAAKISGLLGLKSRLGGTIFGRLLVSGRPDHPECTLSLQGKNLLFNREKIENLTLTGGYAKQIFSVQGTAKAAGVATPMVISGKVPVELSLAPPRLEFIAAGKLDSTIKFSGLQAQSILPFAPVVSQAGGQLDGNIRCSGTLREPVVNGAGTWKDGALEVRLWPHLAQHIEAQWSMDSKGLYFTGANISHLGGTVSVAGRIDYPGFKTFAFQAEGKDLDVPDIFGIEGKATGHAEIKATPETAELTGVLHVAAAHLDLARLETNITQEKTIQVVESSGKGDLLVLKGIQGPNPLANKLSLNLAIDLPPSGSWVAGDGLKAEINGGIKLLKKPGGPLLVAGELHALRGVYSFHGKELKIVEGSVIFPGVIHTEPRLRIVCRKDIKDVTVQALVSGPLKQPKLTLSSIPAMNRVDIVSYFLFGRPAGDLSSAQSSQLQSGASALLGSQGSNIVKSVLGNSVIAPDTIGYRSFNDDYNHIFSFDQTQVNAGKETGIVEMGKDVTPNLHVVYGREVENAQGNGNEVQVEYRVNKSMSFSSQVGGEQTGVDVFWRHDFGK